MAYLHLTPSASRLSFGNSRTADERRGIPRGQSRLFRPAAAEAKAPKKHPATAHPFGGTLGRFTRRSGRDVSAPWLTTLFYRQQTFQTRPLPERGIGARRGEPAPFPSSDYPPSSHPRSPVDLSGSAVAVKACKRIQRAARSRPRIVHVYMRRGSIGGERGGGRGGFPPHGSNDAIRLPPPPILIRSPRKELAVRIYTVIYQSGIFLRPGAVSLFENYCVTRSRSRRSLIFIFICSHIIRHFSTGFQAAFPRR
jgi:hypothetical protein